MRIFLKFFEVIDLKKPLALFFAVVGVLLLIAVPISISFRQPWLVLLFSIASILFIGLGFIVKARLIRTTRPTGGLLLGYNPLLPNCA